MANKLEMSLCLKSDTLSPFKPICSNYLTMDVAVSSLFRDFDVRQFAHMSCPHRPPTVVTQYFNQSRGKSSQQMVISSFFEKERYPIIAIYT